MAVIGTLCLLYYFILRIMTKKWNSTFALFWFAAGVVCCALRMVMVEHPEQFTEARWEYLLIPAAFFVIVECLIVAGMRPSKETELSYVIVLGAQIQGRRVTDSLMRRLDRARLYLKDHPETKVIVAGGQGKGEDTTEAEAMEGFLVVQGIAKERIFREDQSRTTKENLLFAARLLPDMNVPVGIVTNNFHMYRAVRFAKQAGYGRIYRIPAGCHGILFLNYMVREFFAVLKMWIVR